MIYKASFDKLAKGITIATTILFGGIFILGLISMTDGNPIFHISLGIFLFLIYFIAFGLSPKQYQLTPDKLTIHRLFGDVSIDRSQIEKVELVNKEQTAYAIRTFGVGGLFGYYGKFLNKKFGSMTWYATRRDNTVLVQTTDCKKIILTPDEPEKFVEHFLKN